MTIGQVRSVNSEAAADDSSEASLLGLLNVLLRHRWLVVLPAIIAFGLVVAFTLTRPRSYTATVAFVPQVRQSTSAISGLSSQLGIGLAVGDPMQSPQFYVELVQSREVLNDVVETRYEIPSDTGALIGTLAQLYPPIELPPEQQRAALILMLGEQITATRTSQAGIVRLSITTPYRELSPQIADRILGLVNAFNLQTRQSQARAERQFIEKRLAEVATELRNAESRLQTFLQRNREFGPSSSLTIQRERLDRDIATQRTVHTELAQNFERARMEEVRDTPVITVMERPQIPAWPDPRGLLRNAILALLAGAVVGVCLAFAGEYLRRMKDRDAGDYEQFRRLRHDALRDLTHPWRPIARLFRGRTESR